MLSESERKKKKSWLSSACCVVSLYWNTLSNGFCSGLLNRLLQLCQRTMALPVGRGMFTLFSYHPIPAEQLPIPKLNLTGMLLSVFFWRNSVLNRTWWSFLVFTLLFFWTSCNLTAPSVSLFHTVSGLWEEKALSVLSLLLTSIFSWDGQDQHYFLVQTLYQAHSDRQRIVQLPEDA